MFSQQAYTLGDEGIGILIIAFFKEQNAECEQSDADGGMLFALPCPTDFERFANGVISTNLLAAKLAWAQNLGPYSPMAPA